MAIIQEEKKDDMAALQSLRAAARHDPNNPKIAAKIATIEARVNGQRDSKLQDQRRGLTASFKGDGEAS